MNIGEPKRETEVPQPERRSEPVRREEPSRPSGPVKKPVKEPV